MQTKEIRLDEELPPWAQAIGAQLADELIETHMLIPHAILMARHRLEVSERPAPGSRGRILARLYRGAVRSPQ